MHKTLLILALVTALGRAAPAQQSADTTVTVQGFVQEDVGTAKWAIVTPFPVATLGANTYVVALVGTGSRWLAFASRYVAASGRITRSPAGDLTLDVQNIKEVDPPGTTHRIYDRGITRHARISLTVVPNRFAWTDSAGRPTGVNPVMLYTIKNDRSGALFVIIRTNDLACLSVQGSVSAWDSTTKAPVPNYGRFVIQHGGEFRQAFQLPPQATPRPGRYVAHAGICEVDDYDISTEFEVL